MNTFFLIIASIYVIIYGLALLDTIFTAHSLGGRSRIAPPQLVLWFVALGYVFKHHFGL